MLLTQDSSTCNAHPLTLLGNFPEGWSPTGGTWQVESGFYSGQRDGWSVSLRHLTMTSGKLGARVQTQNWSRHSHNGYLVFDYADGDNYKYTGMLDGANLTGRRVNRFTHLDQNLADLGSHSPRGRTLARPWLDRPTTPPRY